MLVVNIDYRNKSLVIKSIVMIFVFLLFVARVDSLHYFLFDSFKKNNRLREQLLVTNVVKKLKEEGVVTISCGNNFELEYLLPESKNFKHCDELLSNSFKSKNVMLVSYFIDPIQRIEVSMKGDQYRGTLAPAPISITSICNKPYLKTNNFLLLWCNVK